MNNQQELEYVLSIIKNKLDASICSYEEYACSGYNHFTTTKHLLKIGNKEVAISDYDFEILKKYLPISIF